MIRQANKYDKTEILEMMKQFRQESRIAQYQRLNNPDYWNELLDSILAGRGVVFIEEGKGLIMGIIGPVIWCNKTLALYELAWWVKPEYRNGTTGYKLVKSYIEYAKKLKQENRIVLFTLSKLPDTPNLDYTKLGFVKVDENWMQ